MTSEELQKELEEVAIEVGTRYRHLGPDRVRREMEDAVNRHIELRTMKPKPGPQVTKSYALALVLVMYKDARDFACKLYGKNPLMWKYRVNEDTRGFGMVAVMHVFGDLVPKAFYRDVEYCRKVASRIGHGTVGDKRKRAAKRYGAAWAKKRGIMIATTN